MGDWRAAVMGRAKTLDRQWNCGVSELVTSREEVAQEDMGTSGIQDWFFIRVRFVVFS